MWLWNMVTVTFQNTFYLEYIKIIFFIIFEISVLKWFKKIKNINLKQIKK
jgi:hypothetical protein